MENIAQLGIKVDSTDIKSATNELSKLSNQSGKTESSTKSLGSAFTKANIAITAVAGSIAAVAKQGVEYSATIERLTNGLTTLNVMTSKNVDSNGKALTIEQKYNLARIESLDIMTKLNAINLQTPHTLEQTVQIYKSMYTSMRSANVTSEQMIDITKKLSIAAGSSGIEFQQLLAGVDGLASGTVEVSSELGRFLKSIGLTNESLKESSNLYDTINNKLKDVQGIQSYDTAVSNLSNSFDQLTGALVAPFFDSVKDGINGLAEQFNDLTTAVTLFYDKFKSISELTTKEQLNTRAIEVAARIAELEADIADPSYFQSVGKLNAELRAKKLELLSINQQYEQMNKQSEQGLVSAGIVRNETELIKLAGTELQKFNLTLDETANKMKKAGATDKEINDYRIKATQEFNDKHKESIAKATADIKQFTDDSIKAYQEIAQIGMSEYEKSLTSINEKYQSWIEAGVDINTALSAQLQLVDELNAQTLSETLLEDLSYYERKVQLQSDSLAKELELQGIAYSNAVLNIENSDKTIEQKERLIELETELYELSIAKLEEDSNTEFQDTLLEFQDEALERQQELNSAIYDFGNGFEDAGNKISKVAKSLAAMANAEIKSKKEREKLDKKYTKEFDKYAGDVEKTKKLEQEYSKETAQINDQSISNQIDGYSNLAGAISGLYEEGSAKAEQWLAIQKILSVVSGVVAIASAMANGDGYTAVARGLAVAATLVSFGWSKGGGGGASVPSVADTAQENLDFENTMVVDRLDRQIELLEELNLQGSASKLQVQSAGLQFDYEKATSINDIRKTMEGNVEKWAGQDALNTFNGLISNVGYKGDIIDYFSANNPAKIWMEYSKDLPAAQWMGQYIDITDRQFMEMRNEFQNKMSDFSLDVIGTINDLKDTGKDLKETYDELTDSQKYANIELMEAINQVDKLRGERSFANYIEDEIENITKLEKELTADRISLLLSEDIADMRAKVDLINYLSDQTGMAFQNGAEDVLNYLDAIELVSEAMTTSTANIKSFYDSFKSDDELAQSLATQMGETLATTYDELAALFVKLENDTLGLTDADLELLESNISFIERLEDEQLAAQNEALQAQKNHLQDKLNAENDYYKTITSSISSITSILSTLDNAIEKLRGASETSETSLSKFYLSMAETQSLMGGNDYDAIKESLSKTVGYSSVLMSTKNFASQEEMAYAQQLAANQLESMDLTLNDELDYLEKIEENTRNTVAALTQSISNMGTQISDSISNQPDYSEIIDKVNGIKDSNTNFVNEVYKNTYGREADEQGLSYWVNQLNTGGLGKSNIQSAMAAAAVGSGEISKSKYVEIFYQLGLGRSADSEALKYWENYDASIYELYDIMRSVAVANGDTYTPFANGGIVTSPTLGLIGEAGYSEAVIPLKNPNDPLNQAALIGEVRALRSEVAYLNTLNEKQTATQIKTLSETRMIKGLSA